MDHKLSVVVQIDLDGRYVRLVVTGCVTETNQHALYPLIRKSRTMIPSATVTIDLTAAEHVEPGAVDLLRWAAAHDDEPLSDPSPIHVLTPTTSTGHHPATALATTASGAPTELSDRKPA